MTVDEKYDIAAELMEMDREIRSYDGDEEIIMYWLQEGIPDHLTEWQIEDYLEFVDNYLDFEQTYRECLRMMEEDC